MVEILPEQLVGVLTVSRKSWSFKEFAPEGIRYSESYEGQLKGLFDADHFSTSDTLRKWDKTTESETLAAEYLANGDVVLLRMKGKSKLTSPTTTRFESKGIFETKSRKLAWLNSAKARIVGEGSPAGGTAKLYADR